MTIGDRQLIEIIKQAIRRTIAVGREEHPHESLAGFALLTNDGLETLSSLSVTSEVLRASSNPDLLFVATDWPYEGDPDAFDAASAELRRRAAAATDFGQHVDQSFELLVKALAEVKAERLFGSQVFLSALSTDPSADLVKLWDSAVQRLNDGALIVEQRKFLERWKSVREE